MSSGRWRQELPPRNPIEPNSPVISKNIWGILIWHKWMVISIAGSATLIYLNFREYAIGGELGKDQAQTADILGALQIAIKAHELVLLVSLVQIAKQWIYGSLVSASEGFVLGLVGAEESLAAPSFVISKLWSFRRAILEQPEIESGEREERDNHARDVSFSRVHFIVAGWASEWCVDDSACSLVL